MFISEYELQRIKERLSDLEKSIIDLEDNTRLYSITNRNLSVSRAVRLLIKYFDLEYDNGERKVPQESPKFIKLKKK